MEYEKERVIRSLFFIQWGLDKHAWRAEAQLLLNEARGDKNLITHKPALFIFITYQLNDFSWNVEGIALRAMTETMNGKNNMPLIFLLEWDLMNSPARWANTPHVRRAKK